MPPSIWRLDASAPPNGGERLDVWVCEYSPIQKAFHIDTLIRVLEKNRRALEAGKNPGYVMLHICATDQEALKFAEEWERHHKDIAGRQWLC